ncbi:hypothetical protein AURANDRAFT_53149, partial [Aureococcus anophagefferens]
MVRRFRDDRGRVQYRGPLLSLLEAPNLKALEAQLIRVLTKAEAKGTTLERAFAYFDQDHGGTISVVELEDALRALGCFRGANSGGVVLLLKRFDENGDGVISLDEFLAFVRQRQREYKERKGLLERKPVANEAALLEARVKAIFLKAEELGVSVVDAFNEFDADGNGQLTVGEFGDALRSLGTFSDLKPREVKAFFDHRDRDGNGTLELEELFALMGRDYADHLLKDAFAAFDRDGSGKLSARELHKALKHVGGDDLFRDVTRKDVEALVRREFDDDGDAEVDIGEFVAFATKPIDDAPRTPGGRRESAELVREKLRAILLRTEQMGTSLKSVFRALDDDGSGALSVKELLRGLRKLGVFQELDADDVEKLVRSDLDRDGNDAVELDEFLAFCRDAPGTGGNVVDDEDADLEIVSRNYEFSLDPDTRCVEKKLRRAARELAGRGGDVRLLLDQYDVEGVGSVIRSDFVQVLMQLGLSLVDGGGPPRG